MFIRNAINRIKDWNSNQYQHNHRYVSLFECASLALDVYAKSNTNSTIPLGWERYKSFHTNDGYKGSLYFKKTPQTNDPNKFDYHIVIAHRGTCRFSDFVLKNVNIVFGKIPSGFAFIWPLISNAIDAFYKQYGSITTIINTGHSLGGVYADLIGAKLDSSDGVFTFENPGTQPILVDAIKKGVLPSAINYVKTYSKNYISDINLVNTCNMQASRVHYVTPNRYNYFYNGGMPVYPIPSVSYRNSYTYGYDQHQMRLLYEKLKDGNALIEETVAHPVGYPEGYRAYCMYFRRKDYWDGYAKIVWEKNIGRVNEIYHNYHDFHNGLITGLMEIFEGKIITQIAKYGIFAQDEKKKLNLEFSEKNNHHINRLN